MTSKRARTESSEGDPTCGLQHAFVQVVQGIEDLLAPLAASLQEGGRLAVLKGQLHEATVATVERMTAQHQELADRRATLDGELELMSSNTHKPEDVITLNVGGTRFTTARSTLTAEASMLATMFSGRHDLPISADGSYFIDRDARQFHHVLNYLRRSFVLPDSEADRAELLKEADFYGLEGLIELISGHGRFERELGVHNLAMRDRESELRRLFAQDPSSPALLDLQDFLIDVYADLSAWVPSADQSWRQLAGAVMLRQLAAKVPNGYQPTEDRCSVSSSLGATSMSGFRTMFAALTDRVFDGFNFLGHHAVVAGGGVLGCMLVAPDGTNRAVHRKQLDKCGFTDSDVDIFMYDMTPEVALEKIRALYEQIRSHGDTTIVRSKLAISFLQDYPRRVIQVVLRIYKSPAEVLAGFDVDACCVCYDGERVWATPRARRAVNGRLNVVDDSRQSFTYESRLLKYALRGFAISVPGHDQTKIRDDLYDLDLTDTTGLAKVLLMERAVQLHYIFGNDYRRFDQRARWNFGDRHRLSSKHALNAVANPAPSDYAGFSYRPRNGYHPFGLVSIFIQGALDANRDVPCVAARNDLAPIIDAGGDNREVRMQLWCAALEADLFGLASRLGQSAVPAVQQRLAKHSATRVPGMACGANNNVWNHGFISGYGRSADDILLDPVTFIPSVPRFINFVTHDAGRQMIGSFHPVDGDFFRDAYK